MSDQNKLFKPRIEILFTEPEINTILDALELLATDTKADIINEIYARNLLSQIDNAKDSIDRALSIGFKRRGPIAR